MCWKFSLVCALALYRLNQSKLYLGRHICLSICLCFYRNSYLSGDTGFNEDMRQRLQARPFFFWLYRCVIDKRLVVAESSFECEQMQRMKLSEMWKAENRLNYWFCSFFASLIRELECYCIDIQDISSIYCNIYKLSGAPIQSSFISDYSRTVADNGISRGQS